MIKPDGTREFYQALTPVDVPAHGAGEVEIPIPKSAINGYDSSTKYRLDIFSSTGILISVILYGSLFE